MFIILLSNISIINLYYEYMIYISNYKAYANIFIKAIISIIITWNDEDNKV